MNSLGFDNIWRMLEENNLQIDLENHSDLICTLCKKILKNTRQSPCGCRFCVECINTYLQADGKICPGNTDYCKLQDLSLSESISVDNAANRALSYLIVNCPEDLCQFRCELRNMEDHIKSHQVTCPFYDLGCSNPRISNEKMQSHLIDETFSHSKLLIDSIQNSKNEMAFLKEDAQTKDFLIGRLQENVEEILLSRQTHPDLIMEKISHLESNFKNIEKENHKLKKDLATALSKIENLSMNLEKEKNCSSRLESQMDEVHISHTIQIRELEDNYLSRNNKIDDCEDRITAICMDIKSLKNNQELTNEFENRIDLIHGLLEFLKEDVDKLNNKLMEIYNKKKDNNELVEVQKNLQTLEEKLMQKEDIMSIIDQHFEEMNLSYNNKIDNVQQCVDRLDDIVQQSRLKQEISQTTENELALLDDTGAFGCTSCEPTKITVAPFDWRIEQFSTKRNQAQAGRVEVIYSEPFYSHESGYKLCLSAFPDGCGSGKRSHLTLGCCVMKGENDELLSWPMKCQITISLINQKFKSVHLSCQFSYKTVTQKNRYRFEKPKGSLNDGVGATRFISFNKLSNDQNILRNDSLLIRCIVDL